MKRVILLLFYLLFSLAILCASTVSFVVPSNIKAYSYDKAVNSSIPENRVVTINLTSSDVIYFTDSAGNEFSSKIFKTKKKAVDASFSWNINNSNLRYSLDGSEPTEINDNKVLLSNFKTNNLSVFTLEVNENDQWLECGKVGFIPVNAKVNRKLILSSYYISSLEILSFKSSTFNSGLGVKASLALPINNYLSLILDSNYQWLKYYNGKYEELTLMGKVRFNSNINDSGIVFIQLGGGENFVTKYNLFAYYPVLSTGLGLEFYFTKSIALSLLGEYSISFQRDSINNHIIGAVGLSIAFNKEAKVWRSLF